MILSVCEKTLNNCVKSDPQFIEHRCEIDALKRNGNRSEHGTNMIPTRVLESFLNLKNVEKRDAEIEIKNRVDPGVDLGGGGARGERFVSEFPDCTSVV